MSYVYGPFPHVRKYQRAMLNVTNDEGNQSDGIPSPDERDEALFGLLEMWTINNLVKLKIKQKAHCEKLLIWSV